jgi:hypothetical protein
MAGPELRGAEELMGEVTDIASFMAHITLAKVCREWEQRPQKCIDIEGDCANSTVYPDILPVAPLFVSVPMQNSFRAPHNLLEPFGQYSSIPHSRLFKSGGRNMQTGRQC